MCISVFPTTGPKQVNPIEVLKILGEKGISSLLIEGGGTINAAFLENKLIDKAIIYIAPKLIGGQHAPTFLEGSGIDKMGDAVELEDTDIIKIGKDFKFVGYPSYKN
jgi:diaminohydroxyphosphoribosylaminopyrimidine deaminase/5-amino-6-(5-phosphoribosylamino)uracil reductase